MPSFFRLFCPLKAGVFRLQNYIFFLNTHPANPRAYWRSARPVVVHCAESVDFSGPQVDSYNPSN